MTVVLRGTALGGKRSGGSENAKKAGRLRRLRAKALLFWAAGGVLSLWAESTVAESMTSVAAARDGQHDFDFNLGTWQIHVERLLYPLTGSNTWVTMEGTKVVQKVWDGRAQIEEVEADGPNGHLENLGLMLYNPNSHQWSLNFADSSQGTLSPPAMGEFKSGRGEFFDSEIYHGRMIAVRFVWSAITRTTHHLEQAFSENGGQTWETNLRVTLTRAPAGIRPSVRLTGAGLVDQHDFDWQMGSWSVHMKRLQHPLTGKTIWTELDGKVMVRPVWDGRANLAEITAEGPSGKLEFLSLRLFNPEAHQWSLNFASSNSGTLSTPMVGEFKDRHGEFYDYEPVKGRMTWVRFTFGDIGAGSNRDEQAFSVDGGRTWETNWINVATRIDTPAHASR